MRDRFAHASRLVASDIATAIAQRKAAFDTAARNPKIAAFLRSAANKERSRADSAAAAAVLGSVVGGRDSLAVSLST